MKRTFKWGMYSIGVLVVAVLLLFGVIYAVSSWNMGEKYEIEVEEVPVSSDSAVIAQGRHIAQIRGCFDCHGEHYEGRVFIDQAPVGVFAGPNLTGGEGSPVRNYSSTKDWVRAIRHGVGADGKPLLFMPSYEYYHLSDQDLTALISYFKSLPEIDNRVKQSSVGPMGRALYMAGDFPLIPAEQIDHQARRRSKPEIATTVEYGAYIATSCSGCHGPNFSGGKIPGTPPEWPPATNITPDVETGLGSWTYSDFNRLLNTGIRPDSSKINTQYMPISQTSHLTETEKKAIWAYLQSLPARKEGKR